MNEKLDLRAHTLYGDFRGDARADESMGLDLDALAKEHGVDMDRFYIYAVRFNMPEPFARRARLPRVTLYLVDQNKVGRGFEGIHAYMRANGGELPLQEVGGEMPYEQFFACFKRFDVVLKRRDFENAVEVEDDSEEE